MKFMKGFSSLIVILMLSTVAHAQTQGDILISGNADLIKTDNDKFLDKAQIGLEGNYFLTPKFTGTGGLEIWTDEKISLVMGTRYYPTEEAFVRFRGLIGENDLSLGAGWSKPIHSQLRFEAIGDFYFSIDFAIRAGFTYIIRK